MKMSRRSAIATATSAVAASAAASLGQRLSAAEAAIGSKGCIHHSVCKWCYPKIELEALAIAGKEFGLRSIELLEVKEIPTVQKHGLTCAMVSGIPGGITKGLNRVENHDRVVKECERMLALAAKAGVPNLMLFSGNRKGMTDSEGLKNCAIGLKRVMPIAQKHGVTILMELLNSRVDHHDYMCDRTPWGVELVKQVGSDRFRMLYDIYHMQIMEGDVIRTIRDNQQYIGHYHTAGNPGRNEIDATQELNYLAICETLKAIEFKGFLAQEFMPRRDPMTSLREAIDICDV